LSKTAVGTWGGGGGMSLAMEEREGFKEENPTYRGIMGKQKKQNPTARRKPRKNLKTKTFD